MVYVGTLNSSYGTVDQTNKKHILRISLTQSDKKWLKRLSQTSVQMFLFHISCISPQVSAGCWARCQAPLTHSLLPPSRSTKRAGESAGSTLCNRGAPCHQKYPKVDEWQPVKPCVSHDGRLQVCLLLWTGKKNKQLLYNYNGLSWGHINYSYRTSHLS